MAISFRLNLEQANKLEKIQAEAGFSNTSKFMIHLIETWEIRNKIIEDLRAEVETLKRENEAKLIMIECYLLPEKKKRDEKEKLKSMYDSSCFCEYCKQITTKKLLKKKGCTYKQAA